TNSILRPQVHREVGDVVSSQHHRSSIRSCQSHNHVESCGFARTIRPQQSYDLSRVNGQTHVANNGSPLICLGDACSRESRHFLTLSLEFTLAPGPLWTPPRLPALDIWS